MEVLFTLTESEESLEFNCDFAYHALLASIQGDPKTYREAMSRPDGHKWLKAANKEADSIVKNEVGETVDRPGKDSKGIRPNIIDSRWVFKTKVNDRGEPELKARLVIRGFKDKNSYELRETYAPVSRIPLVRAMLAIANKRGFIIWQLDVKTAFLHSEINGVVYMEIPEGFGYSEADRKTKVWRLKKSLYGLKTSPKSWNKHFTFVAIKIGLIVSERDPCIFYFIHITIIVIILLYVDDILMIGNDVSKMTEIRECLAKELDMKFLGKPREFLGIAIEHDEKNKVMKLNQSKFVDKMLNKFGYKDVKPQRTPMTTHEGRSKERRLREDEPGTASETDIRRYREIVGSLLYLTNVTRPDIS